MCRYCEDNCEIYYDSDDIHAYLTEYDGEWYLTISDYANPLEIKVRACPWCGRKLNE